jgi:molecular chaperone DnaK (HSP70)
MAQSELRAVDDDNATGESTAAWIGIDWGTSNCAVAVYSRRRGGPKWLRLAEYGLTRQSPDSDKAGRLVPSTLVLATREFVQEHQLVSGNETTSGVWQDVSDIVSTTAMKGTLATTTKTTTTGDSKTRASTQQLPLQLFACCGAAAQDFQLTTTAEWQIISAATIRSVKRLILQQLTTAASSNGAMDLPATVTVTPLGCHAAVSIAAGDIVAVFLRALQRAARPSLVRYLRQHRLPPWDLPGMAMPPSRGDESGSATSSSTSNGGTTKPFHDLEAPLHVCLGVPAAAPVSFRQLLRQAAHRAGFAPSAVTITESTAAAMAYGLYTNRVTSSPTGPAEATKTAPSRDTVPTTGDSNTTTTTILVFDMGGGTTDVTIAEKTIRGPNTEPNESNEDLPTSAPSSSGTTTDFEVCVTVGNDQLGGDDMDEALRHMVWNKAQLEYPQLPWQSPIDAAAELAPRQQFLDYCRIAKLALCGNVAGKNESKPASAVQVPVPHYYYDKSEQSSKATKITITVTQRDWDAALKPILEQTRALMELAISRYTQHQQQELNEWELPSYPFDEVILIGGASRVPSIRRLLMEMALTRQELCTSVHADSAVAQGCAIAAAVESKTIPLHELQSALMLDTIPHPIGVLLTNHSAEGSMTGSNNDRIDISSNVVVDEAAHFVEILPRYTTLPARHYATFQLALADQAGVSLKAVEQISEDGDLKYASLGEFNFLLHRLTQKQLALLPDGVRSIDIGMELRPNGEFVVSIFDSNDPDHIRKRERYVKSKGKVTVGDDDWDRTELPLTKDNDGVPLEQISLVAASLVLFVLYVAVKLCFRDIDVHLSESQ